MGNKEITRKSTSDLNGLKEKDDEELLDYAVNQLEKSFENRDSIFHSSHLIVDKIREEFEDRGKEEKFSLAFRRFDQNISGKGGGF